MTDRPVLPFIHHGKASKSYKVAADFLNPNALVLQRRSFLVASSSFLLQLIGCNHSKDKDTVSTTSTSTVNAGVVTTLAGSSIAGSVNATGIAASFKYPRDVAVDSTGNIYVADAGNNMIRKITAAGVVTTLAGSTTSGSADGTGTAASFYYPGGITVDSSGNVYVSDAINHMIRKITAAGVVTTLAGSTSSGSTNGSSTAASFFYPYGLAVDSLGNLYVADSLNHMIRKITSAGVVTTFAGSTTSGSSNSTGTYAKFNNPKGICIDSIDNVYVADTGNHMIRKITAGGVVTTLAGATASGSADGTGTAASFYEPTGITVDSSGNVYVADTSNNIIRKITAAGVVTTFVGSGAAGNANGTGTAATFHDPKAIAVNSSGTLYVADSTNNLIRKIA